MGNVLFGKPKAIQHPAAPAVLTQIETLDKKATHLQALIAKYGDRTAAALAAGRKPEAMRWLRVKKQAEAQLQTVYGMLDKLHALNGATQMAVIQQMTLASTEKAVRELKQQDVDKAQDLMDEAAEVLETSRQMNEIFTRDADDPELEAELMEIGVVQAAAQVQVPVLPVLPEPPTTRPVMHRQDALEVEEELRQLAAAC